MGVLKGIKNLIAFLTTIPVGMEPDCLRDANGVALALLFFALFGVPRGM